MSYGEAEFRADFEHAQRRALGFYPGIGVEVPHAVAWQLYQNVSMAPLGLQIIGRRLAGASEEPVGIGAAEIQNFGAVDDERPGSVLDMSRDRWNLTINDVWLLAAVHAGQEFHACAPSPLPERVVLHPSFGCTLTGRELVGLAMAGYEEARHPSTGTAYVCGDRTKASNMTLLDYQRRMESLGTKEQVLRFLTEAGFVIVP